MELVRTFGANPPGGLGQTIQNFCCTFGYDDAVHAPVITNINVIPHCGPTDCADPNNPGATQQLFLQPAPLALHPPNGIQAIPQVIAWMPFGGCSASGAGWRNSCWVAPGLFGSAQSVGPQWGITLMFVITGACTASSYPKVQQKFWIVWPSPPGGFAPKVLTSSIPPRS